MTASIAEENYIGVVKVVLVDLSDFVNIVVNLVNDSLVETVGYISRSILET